MFENLTSTSSIEHILTGAVGIMVISAAVRSLPEPVPPYNGFWSYFYAWFYKFTHAVLQNFDKSSKVDLKDRG